MSKLKSVLDECKTSVRCTESAGGFMLNHGRCCDALSGNYLVSSSLHVTQNTSSSLGFLRALFRTPPCLCLRDLTTTFSESCIVATIRRGPAVKALRWRIGQGTLHRLRSRLFHSLSPPLANSQLLLRRPRN